LGLLSGAFLAEFFDNEVIYLLVELHDMIPMKLIVDMPETYLGILRAYFDLDGVFLGQEGEFFKGSLEVLDLAKY
jgi:hypothetical protein